MAFTPIKYCPITDQPTTGSTISSNYFEYKIVFNNQPYIIRLALIEGWSEGINIKADEKLVLQGMLYNAEWPIDKETLISPNFIGQLIRLGEYPKNFPEKLNYYLLKCYLNGGKEYKPIEYDISKYLVAYGIDENEFSRIIDGLNSKELIKLPNNESIGNRNFAVKFNLTEKGVELAEQLNQVQLAKEPKRFNGNRKPSITIVATKNDDFYANILKDYLLKQGISVTSNNGIDEDDNFSTVTNSKSGLYSEKNDYVIFIKSEASDKNNSFGSILDIAIEAHENTIKRNFNYLYFAFIDDSKGKTRPRIDNYYQTFYDFRIISNRKQLLLDIARDWQRRYPVNASAPLKYNFPAYELSDHERTWLKTVYQKFLSNEKFEYRHLLSKMWDDIPKDFEPHKMSPLLLRSGYEITLLGIWSIDPHSKVFENFDKVVFAIREILKSNNEVKSVSSNEIIPLVPGITHQEIFQVFKLLFQFGGFANGFGSNENDSTCNIGVDDDNIYRQYRNYSGVEDLVNNFVSKNSEQKDTTANSNEKKQEELLNKTIDLKSIHSHKTKFAYRDTNNIKPVMGVVELSADLAEIIDNLPIQKEKGQMIGIFGKWRRGKTFLLKELWNVLEEKELEKKKIYTKIEYHAWKYQETPASWAYLYEKFVSEFLGRKKGVFGGIKYYSRLIDLNYERLGAWPIVKFFLTLFAAIATPIVSSIFLKWYYSIALIPILLVAFLSFLKKLYKEFSTKAIDLVKLYSVRHSFKEAMGIQADIQEELIKLLKVWIPESELGKRKILLVVEDIDRCTEERIIQNIDALRVMLDDDEISKRVIIVTAIDERILKNAIRLKYDSILSNNEGTNELHGNVPINELISEYIDKLFISAIKLGGLTSEQRHEYLNELLEQEVDKEVIKEYQKNENLEKIKGGYNESGMSKEIMEALLKDPSYLQMQERSKLQEQLMEQTGKENLDLAIRDGDFVIQDGDIALEDEKGNITSMPEIENNINERIKNQNKFEKLSAIEVDLISKVVGMWLSATPRRVRIFYYRYLLCKNLLINKYSILKRVNVWQNKEGINAMMNLILEHNKAHDPDLISKEKSRIIDSVEERISVTFGKETITSYRVDYLYLLEVLELVIAY